MKYLLAFCLLFSSALAFAEPEIREYEQAYPIQGSTAEKLREQMNQERPESKGERFDADTHWNIKWHYDFLADTKSCVIGLSQVTETIVYRLPHWVNQEDADPKLQKKWDNYLKHLRLHESGHAKNGRAAAEEIEAMLKNLAPVASCPLLDKIANERAQQIILSHNAWDLEYDKETRHGATQGAVFP